MIYIFWKIIFKFLIIKILLKCVLLVIKKTDPVAFTQKKNLTSFSKQKKKIPKSEIIVCFLENLREFVQNGIKKSY